MAWSLYLVRTRDGALYTGIARDVGRRLTEHAGGSRGAKALRGRGPLTLAYRVEIGDRSLGQAVERRVKRLTKGQKEALVAASPPAVDLIASLGMTPPPLENPPDSGE